MVYFFFSVLTNMLQSVVTKYLEIIKEDTDRTVVMTSIDSLFEMLEKIGRPVLEVQGSTGAILARMKEAFTHKVRIKSIGIFQHSMSCIFFKKELKKKKIISIFNRERK